jgi:GDP-L-fucose synthase
MSFYKNKKVLVTGGTGLIGIPLVIKLVRAGANVYVTSADSFERFHVMKEFITEFEYVQNFVSANLENYDSCYSTAAGIDYVFQLAGSKGAASIGKTKAATFLTSHLFINLNMLKAARECGVKKYLLTSTTGIYPPGSPYIEYTSWEAPAGESDKYSSWAKRISELAAEAFMIEHDWPGIVIVRPGSIYGPWDNFDKDTSMVVGSLIGKFVRNEESPVKVYGDGSSIRDFTYTNDIADGMLLALEKSGNCEVFNLSSGKEYHVKELVELIYKYTSEDSKSREYIWTGPTSFKMDKRVLDITKAQTLLGYKPSVGLEEGIKKTVRWYRQNKDIANIRYNAFK